MSTTKQRWRCPVCDYTYDSPMRVTEVLCEKTHTAADYARARGKSSNARGRSGKVCMELVQGDKPNEPNRKKKTAHGSTQLRRA